MFDLKEAGAMPQREATNVAQDLWPKVGYHGHEVFEIYCKELDSFAVELTNADGNIDSLQESYLGYSPSRDRFYCAHDAWTTDDATHALTVVTFAVDRETGHISDYSVMGRQMPRMFYPHGLIALHNCVPDLINIRLD